MTKYSDFFYGGFKKKKFRQKCIEWVHQIVFGGRVGIDINGEPGEFFKTYKGLRQGTLCHLCFSIW
jgi:hypothetical protein